MKAVIALAVIAAIIIGGMFYLHPNAPIPAAAHGGRSEWHSKLDITHPHPDPVEMPEYPPYDLSPEEAWELATPVGIWKSYQFGNADCEVRRYGDNTNFVELDWSFNYKDLGIGDKNLGWLYGGANLLPHELELDTDGFLIKRNPPVLLDLEDGSGQYYASQRGDPVLDNAPVVWAFYSEERTPGRQYRGGWLDQAFVDRGGIRCATDDSEGTVVHPWYDVEYESLGNCYWLEGGGEFYHRPIRRITHNGDDHYVLRDNAISVRTFYHFMRHNEGEGTFTNQEGATCAPILESEREDDPFPTF